MTAKRPDPLPQSGLAAVREAVDDADAAGFVHVGSRRDPDRRYLTRVDAPDREAALVFMPSTDDQPARAVYCVPAETTADAAPFTRCEDGIDLHVEAIERRVDGRNPRTATGQQVRSVLADGLAATEGETLLVPRGLPHDAAVFLQDGGYELQSTSALVTARVTKTPAERDRLRAVQTAATAGLARAEAVLAASEPRAEGLTFEGEPLSAVRLARLLNGDLAAAGVSPAANTTIAAETASDTAATAPDDPLPVGTPIRLEVAPQGPAGYHGHLIRTVAVDSDGGWERRAFVAAAAGLDAAVDHAAAGVDVAAVADEAAAEVGAYGFAPPDAEPTRARSTAAAHGIGLSTHEPPVPGRGRERGELRPGSVIAVSAGVADPDRGTIRLGTLCSVTESRADRLVDYPTSLSPVDRLDDSD
ncbi:M24 family metallopeptidase [Halohasta salina]|uniref:M24 family metallopeptidase n=1 Tax=Halohasta salina TaxID=2961621 RepID=UPI0020A59123|nr:M24 family metallopeptidase [Halohasta salina]